MENICRQCNTAHMFVHNKTGLCLECQTLEETPESLISQPSVVELENYGQLTVMCPFRADDNKNFISTVAYHCEEIEGWIRYSKNDYTRETFKEVFQYNLEMIKRSDVILVKILDGSDNLQPEIMEYMALAKKLGKPVYAFAHIPRFIKHPLIQEKVTYISNNLPDIVNRIGKMWF